MAKRRHCGDVLFFRFGNPFKTGAVISAAPEFSEKSLLAKYFKIKSGGGKATLEYSFADGDRMFGLGQCLGALDRRGRRYRIFATDDNSHTPEKESLYGAHPFAIISGASCFGFFIDCPSEIIVDAGFTDRKKLAITVNSSDLDLYIFTSPPAAEIIKDYLTLTGRPYIPPRWAFGYQQCRWSYPDRASVEEVAAGFEKHGIPCEAIYLDIDYMEKYKVFTVDEKKFPDFRGFAADLKKRGFRLIAIIDPGVKIEKGYGVYEEGVRDDFFCRDAKGRFFRATVWPGLTHLPDFLNPLARKWWGGLYKRLTDLGVEGFWNDMNEPAIFHTPESVADALRTARGRAKNETPAARFEKARGKFNKMSNARLYYPEFYHSPEPGAPPVNHEKVHNIYGFNMALAASDGLDRAVPGRRHFLLSRASYAGMHRFSAVWTGDNASWWEHLAEHMRMMISLNMAGFFYCGADVGGFGCDASAELIVRWTQLGAVTPLFRNHSAMGTRRQEPWAFDDHTAALVRGAIKLRYALMPYIYSEFMRCAAGLSPFISPLFLSYADPVSAETGDQFMVGRSLMAAPVHAPNAAGRFVHLPGRSWLYWAASSADDREMAVLPPGAHYVNAGLDELPLFIAENSMIALDASGGKIGESRDLTVVGFVPSRASFTYYDDDGETTEFENGVFSELKIEVINRGGYYETQVSKKESPRRPLKIRSIDFEIYDGSGRMTALKTAVY